MMASGITKDFGVIACDSAMYNTEMGEMSFESQRLIIIDAKKIMTFIGTHLYLANIERPKLSMPFDALCLYLKDYLKGERPKVAAAMKEAIADEDENKPHFCLFVMGIHNGHPTLAQFNSFVDFEPQYLYSANGLKFATILYGDDSKPEKKEMFKEAKQYMELKAKQAGANVSPGIVGEILTRGIYHKADEEMKIGTKRKYAGGVVNVAMVTREGVKSLSGFCVI